MSMQRVQAKRTVAPNGRSAVPAPIQATKPTTAPAPVLAAALTSVGEWTRRHGEWVLGGATGVAMMIALWMALVSAPTSPAYAALYGDGGVVFRIFYFHVPIAWCAYLAFFVVFAASAYYLWRGDPRADRLARTSAELGVMFTTLTLISGSIFGRPTWGAWWAWDPRLTTTLILWFIYVGYLLLRFYMGEAPGGARAAAVLGILGFLDVPINYLSVEWWVGQHPSLMVTLTRGGVANQGHLAGGAVLALMVCLLAFTLLYAFLMLQLYRLEGLREVAASLRARIEMATSDMGDLDD